MKQSSQGLATSGRTTLAWSASPPFPAGGSTNGPYRTVVTCTPPTAGSAPAGREAGTTAATSTANPSAHPSRLIMYGTVPEPSGRRQDPFTRRAKPPLAAGPLAPPPPTLNVVGPAAPRIQSNSASGRVSPY